MTRIGVAPSDALELRRTIDFHRGIRCEGTFTHFATADVPDDWDFALQLNRFRNTVAALHDFDPERPTAVFHTFADGILRREIRRELDRRGIPSIDLLGPAVTVLSTLTGEEPTHAVGATFGK